MRLTHSNLESTTDVLEGYTFVGNINKHFKLIVFSKIRCKYKLNITEVRHKTGRSVALRCFKKECAHHTVILTCAACTWLLL